MVKFLNEYPDLNLTVKAGELMKMAEQVAKLTRQEMEQANTKATETYLSRTEVAKMIGVDPSTLWRWHKQGYLCAVELGGKRIYKLSEVERILGGRQYGNN
jgi:predicted DNA-binding transcriptional regulator AlpA